MHGHSTQDIRRVRSHDTRSVVRVTIVITSVVTKQYDSTETGGNCHNGEGVITNPATQFSKCLAGSGITVCYSEAERKEKG